MCSEKGDLDLSALPDLPTQARVDIHPYFGRINASLAAALIQQLSKPLDTVLDPFCGSGTVLQEALLAQRRPIGWDSSPLATMIARTRLLGNGGEAAALDSLAAALWEYSDGAGAFRKSVPPGCDVPPMARVHRTNMWFSAIALKELAFIKTRLAELLPMGHTPEALIAWTAFSRIIVRASNQQGESSYRRIERTFDEGAVIGLFLDSLRQTRAAVASASRARQQVSLPLQSSEILECDSRFGPPPTNTVGVDLVITSPPYLMAWDYGLYHKFRFYWLDFDLDEYEFAEIGRHLRRKNDDVERYTEDMAMVFKTLSLHLVEGGRIAMINAPSVVHGKLIDTNKILVQSAAQTGFECREQIKSIPIPGPHHGMYASLSSRNTNTAGRSGKREHVLVFERG